MTTQNPLPRSTPESQGIPSTAVQQFVEAVERSGQELHSLMLLRHGNVVAEGWWYPYTPAHPHMMFSVSKSFTSTAVGLAVAEGHLSVEDRVLSFFPKDAPEKVGKNLDAMQVQHLLSMSTGHAKDTTTHMIRKRGGNWTRAFLEVPVRYAPGTHFLYNTGATYMLSAIVQKVTGQRLIDYLRPRLFEPLGIQNPVWELSPQGINTGGFGLSITTEDLARFGQLYLQKGRWQGKRLLPESWMEAATSRQISNGNQPDSDWSQGYGYQFWRCRHGSYRGDGAFGQYCIVMPDQDVVMAMTGGLKDMQVVLALVWDHLLPAIGTLLPEKPSAHQRLVKKLAGLTFTPPQGKASSPVAASVSGKTYTMDRNPLRIKTMTFDFANAGNTVTIRTTQDEHRFVCKPNVWQDGIMTLFGHSPCVMTSGTWTNEKTFLITLRFYETSYIYTLTCQFEDKHLTIDGEVNVSFGPTLIPLFGEIRS